VCSPSANYSVKACVNTQLEQLGFTAEHHLWVLGLLLCKEIAFACTGPGMAWQVMCVGQNMPEHNCSQVC
jgi:hypothetical protein